ncbi:MAG: type II secretion system F family protein [Deltaproteobacteria bacterium]|nr:type II secretion system F family protein [Deltaproteobacteria bacterium]
MSAPVIVAVLVGIACFTLIQGLFFLARGSSSERRRLVRRRLDDVKGRTKEAGAGDLLLDRRLGSSDRADRLLRAIPQVLEFQHLINSAGFRYRAGNILGLIIVTSLVLAMVGVLFEWAPMTIVIIMVLPLVGAVMFFRARASARQEKILEQLPDALDLIARSVRAGYAFAGGFQMVADEMPDPLASEFKRALEERNFGAGLREVMENLSERIDLMESRLFSTAVLVQAESGGNLAEVLDNLAMMIRERFRLRGKVRTLSAEGRLSAVFLIALPCLLLIWLWWANPDYLRPIFEWQYGAAFIGGVVFWVLVGILWIWRIIQIKF